MKGREERGVHTIKEAERKPFSSGRPNLSWSVNEQDPAVCGPVRKRPQLLSTDLTLSRAPERTWASWGRPGPRELTGPWDGATGLLSASEGLLSHL